MSAIDRKPKNATKTSYDLIIVGGGIYGVSLALMASLNGKRPLLVEKDDFGANTTFNHLRIVHGGLRYLQKLDLHRFFESINERRWFFRNFPHLVEPIPCMMPLYGKGMKRPAIFGPALKVNDFLSRKRNDGVLAEKQIPNGKLISKADTAAIFPQVDQEGLQASAIWFDGSMPDSQIQLIEMLSKACEMGTTALNYCEALDLDKDGNSVTGLKLKDSETGEILHFKSSKVINTAGPWCRWFAKDLDKDYPELFHRSLAWNVFINRPQLSSHALAITPKLPDAQTYFLRPLKGKFMAGTIHEPCDNDRSDPYPSEASIQQFLDNLNTAIPGLDLTQKDIIRIYAGFLPAKKDGSNQIAVREVLKDHALEGGPKGLFSVSGVKFTTARLVGEKALKMVFPEFIKGEFKENLPGVKHTKKPASVLNCFDTPLEELNSEMQSLVQQEADNASTVHLDDLLFRRTSIGENPERAQAAAKEILQQMKLEEKTAEELDRIKQHFHS